MPASRAPETRSALRAAALYAYAVGVLVASLSIALEPREFKDLPHGIFVGLLVARLPLVLLPLAAAKPSDRLAFVELFAWALAVGAALPGLHPSLFLFPLLEVLPPGALALLAVAYGAAIIETLVATIRATARVPVAVFEEILERGVIKAAITGALASVGALVVAALLAYGPTLEWVDPPITFDTRAAVSLALLGPLVFIARAGAEQPPIPRDELDPGARAGARSLGMALALIVVLEAIAVAEGDDLAPFGVFPSSLVVEASAAHPELARDGVTEDLFRMAQRRSGLSAGGERFVVSYGAGLVGAPFDSDTVFASDGRVLILMNEETAPASRRRNLLLYQFARGLLALRAPTTEREIALGYAYWVADNTKNPFAAGLKSGASPRAACDGAANARLEPAETFSYALASLPFVQAELRGGVGNAQRLLLQLAHSDLASFVQLIATECAAYLAAHPAEQELVLETSDLGADQINEFVSRSAFDDAKRRSGMDALGRLMLVKLGTPPGGAQAHSDFTDGTQIVITLSPAIPADRRREALTFMFTGIFATVRYGIDVEPVRSGFASWAAKESANPFTTGAAAGRSLCQTAGTWDLAGGTSGTVYLSSIPFLDAEEAGGVGSAQQLARDWLSKPTDLAGWRALVQRGCLRRFP